MERCSWGRRYTHMPAKIALLLIPNSLEEVVPVGVVLLLLLVAQHLQALAVADGHEGQGGDALLYTLDNGVLAALQEDAERGADLGLFRAAVGGDDARALQTALRDLDDVVGLLCGGRGKGGRGQGRGEKPGWGNSCNTL